MDEKDIKCGYSTIVAINRELEELKGKVQRLQAGTVDLADLTKAQLIVVAKDVGVDPGGLSKADIIKAIEAAQAE